MIVDGKNYYASFVIMVHIKYPKTDLSKRWVYACTLMAFAIRTFLPERPFSLMIRHEDLDIIPIVLKFKYLFFYDCLMLNLCYGEVFPPVKTCRPRAYFRSVRNTEIEHVFRETQNISTEVNIWFLNSSRVNQSRFTPESSSPFSFNSGAIHKDLMQMRRGSRYSQQQTTQCTRTSLQAF